MSHTRRLALASYCTAAGLTMGVGGCAPPDDTVWADDAAPQDFLARFDEADCDAIVEGTGDPTVDAPALQAAVNAGGTVCLSGTLAFANTLPPAGPGPGQCSGANNSQVCINPPLGVLEVNIVGLDGPDGKATVTGGVNNFLVPAVAQVRTVRLVNLRIVGASSSAILVFRTWDLFEILGVDIEGVNALNLGAFTSQIGINISNFPGFAAAGGGITGTVNVVGNTIDAGTGAVAVAPAGIGLFGFRTAAGVLFPIEARVEIIGNVTDGWSGSGIQALFANDAYVFGNVVHTGAFANTLAPGTLSPCAAPNRLGAASGIGVGGAGNVSVEANAIVVEPALDATGVPAACQVGVLLAESTNTVVDDTIVWANGVSGARGILAINSSSNEVGDFVVVGGGTGVELVGSSSNTVEDGLLTKPATGIRLTNTSGNRLDHILILRPGTAIQQTNSNDTLTDIRVW